MDVGFEESKYDEESKRSEDNKSIKSGKSDKVTIKREKLLDCLAEEEEKKEES